MFKFYFEDVAIRHIEHKYSADMSKKSEVVGLNDYTCLNLPFVLHVSLGISLHSEQKYDEMLCILDNLYKYVPRRSFTESVSVNDEEYSLSTDVTHTILLGGDQMTAARCRGCQSIRSNSTNDSDKLNGFHPVAEDWHTKVILLEVCMHACINVNVINVNVM